MNEQQENRQVGGQDVLRDQCLCHQFLDHLRNYLGVSPEVKQHLANSRVEFLKAIREVIDQRIEHLSRKSQPGTKIPVE